MSILNVDTLRANTIQSSNGTTALTIDPTGRIKTPNIPAFHAFNPTLGVSVAADGVIPLSTIKFDNTNNYSTANSRFIAPISGLYYFMTNMMTNNDASYAGDHRLFVNGAQTSPQTAGYGLQANLVGSSYRKAVLTAILSLNASDYVDVRSIGAASWYGSATNTHCSWSGYLIG
jgi:hypothetical protein